MITSLLPVLPMTRSGRHVLGGPGIDESLADAYVDSRPRETYQRRARQRVYVRSTRAGSSEAQFAHEPPSFPLPRAWSSSCYDCATGDLLWPPACLDSSPWTPEEANGWHPAVLRSTADERM